VKVNESISRCAQQRHSAFTSTAANMENPAIAGFAFFDHRPPLTRRRRLFRSLNFSLSYKLDFVPSSHASAGDVADEILPES
jgi:hypothetical protein